MEIWSNSSNITAEQLCAGFYAQFLAVPDIMMVVLDLPLSLLVIGDLLLKRWGVSAGPRSSSPSSNSELFFLHVTSMHFWHYVGVLLTIIRNLGAVSGIHVEYITALESCSLIGESIFFAFVTLDLYLAVAHPVAYVVRRTSTRRSTLLLYCWLVWLYTITIGTLIIVFKLPMYYPLTMLSFLISVPASLLLCAMALVHLHSEGPGQMSRTKQNASRFITSSLIASVAYYLPYMFLFVYIVAKNIDWNNMPCDVQFLVLTLKIVELLVPLGFFCYTGMLKEANGFYSAIGRKVGLCQ